uniref:C-type lectin domain-containing protein n=1 Tax=Panagrellus redivivus TaxID=6233 RepID=A0A7E4V3I2_PANRE
MAVLDRRKHPRVRQWVIPQNARHRKAHGCHPITSFDAGSIKSCTECANCSIFQRYSCALEADAKFECLPATYERKVYDSFVNDKYTWRAVNKHANKNMAFYWSIFKTHSPWNPTTMMIDPDNQTTLALNPFDKDTIRLILSPDVTEIGCFRKICGEYEYIACKTGQVVVTKEDKPLYTPGKRCQIDSDCTLPGYPRCDADSGLCDIDLNAKLEKSIVPPLVCIQQFSIYMRSSKEKCNGVYDTGSDHSQAERNKIVVFVNKFRALINNNCTLCLGVLKPASNYRKVKYSCALEIESQFECSTNSTTDNFKDDGLTWKDSVYLPSKTWRSSSFEVSTPVFDHLLVDPDTQAVNNTSNIAVFIRLFMSEDVTEVGCFVKVCGNQEYIACRTNHDRNLPNNEPLYTPGRRCNSDADCTLPGYNVCDASLGLCDYKTHHELKKEALSNKCEIVRFFRIETSAEKCGLNYDTGSAMSNKERESIVYIVNQYRKLVNNNCDLGKGVVRHVTNYRKVKYSCAFEEEAKFECSNLNDTTFYSDKNTWRYAKYADLGYRTTIFGFVCPWNQFMMIDPDHQTISETSESIRDYLRLILSPEVTEIGCFNKICGDYEYIACKSGHTVVAPKGKPLYKPGHRCLADEDCTLPGYGICDTDSGLCEADFGNHLHII